MTWTSLLGLVMVWIATLAFGQSACRNVEFEGLSFTVCEANPATDDIRLWLNDADGDVLGTFSSVNRTLAAEGRQLAFATNGGMYHPNRSPVGHYVEDGVEARGVITSEGPGNFGLLPNGILCLSDGAAEIWESRTFAETSPACRFATQSGPLLVIDGELHPRFIEDSPSEYIRNGVGVADDGRLIVAISNNPVNFHRFARLFRDALGTDNALFLDGNISRLHARDLGRSDAGFPLGPILGVTEPRD